MDGLMGWITRVTIGRLDRSRPVWRGAEELRGAKEWRGAEVWRGAEEWGGAEVEPHRGHVGPVSDEAVGEPEVEAVEEDVEEEGELVEEVKEEMVEPTP